MIESATEVILARSRDHEGWVPVVALSIAAHVLLVAIVALMPEHDFSSDAPKTVMTISLGGSPGPRAGGMTPMGGRAVQQVKPTDAKPGPETPPAATTPAIELPSKNARVKPRSNPEVASREASGTKATSGDEVREGSARADTGARGQGFGLSGGGGAGAGAYLDVGDF